MAEPKQSKARSDSRGLLAFGGACFACALAWLGLALFSLLKSGNHFFLGLGLLAPLVPAGIVFAWLGWKLLLGGPLPAPQRLYKNRERRFRLLLVGPTLLLALLLVAPISLQILHALSNRPAVAGVLLATLPIGVLTLGSFFVDRISRLLLRSQWQVSFNVAALASFSIFAGGVALFIFMGSSSGEGGWGAIFGVLKRSELN
ncbi:MAG: hypothetical protein MK135_10795, partial [Polyangiaceae bacterium]|nr:hypothetical protein [Polyangiaceae bacterium]